MKGFGIYVKNDLLEPKHYKAMVASLWLYLWLLDHITSVNEKGIGKVLGGRPVKLPEIQKDIPLSEKTYTRYIDRLVTNKYITALRTPYGYVFTINKAVKLFGNKENRKSVVSLKKERTVLLSDVENRTFVGNKEDNTLTKQILGDFEKSQQLKKNNMGWNIPNDNDSDLPSIGDDGEVEQTDQEKLKKENEKVRALMEWGEKVRGKSFLDKPTQIKHIKLLKGKGISPTKIKDTFVELVQSDYWKNSDRLPDFKTVVSTLKNER